MSFERGETVAKGKCYACAGTVAVKVNRGGKAYYRCDDCGIEMRHHWQRSSDKMLSGLGVGAPPPMPTSAAPKAEEKPQEPEKSGSLLSMILKGE